MTCQHTIPEGISIMVTGTKTPDYQCIFCEIERVDRDEQLRIAREQIRALRQAIEDIRETWNGTGPNVTTRMCDEILANLQLLSDLVAAVSTHEAGNWEDRIPDMRQAPEFRAALTALEKTR